MRRRSPISALQKNALASAITAAMMTGGITAAYGQDDDEDENEVDAQQQSRVTEDVIVTGTRIRRDDFSAPNSTTVINAEDMRALGVISVADMVNQLPNNVASVSPEAGVESEYNVGASVANLRGLNTFFGTRTLTLVNNRRQVSSTNGGAVDMNMIPSALVGRIETVTGGASATYGADAMAGVVNVIMDDNVQDVRVDLGYQTTDEHDGDRYNFSLGTGAQVFDGRGNFTVGIDIVDQEGINDCTTRDYCRQSRGIIQNGSAGGNPAPYETRDDGYYRPGEPHFVFEDGLHYTNVQEGMIWEDFYEVGDGVYRFTPDGRDIMPYLTVGSSVCTDGEILDQATYDYIRNQGSQGFTQCSGGSLRYKNQPLRPDTENNTLYTAFTYDLDSGISLDTSFRYASSQNTAIQNNPRTNFHTYCIQPSNAYIQPAWGASQQLRDVIYSRTRPAWYNYDAGSGDFHGDCIDPPYLGGSYLEENINAGFSSKAGMVIHSDMSGQISRINTTERDSYTFDIGADGDLFEGGSWTWETYWSYGKTDAETRIKNWQSDNRVEMALDTVYDPVLGPQCRINAPNYVPQTAEFYGDQGINLGPEEWQPLDQPLAGDQTAAEVRDEWVFYYRQSLLTELDPQVSALRNEVLAGYPDPNSAAAVNAAQAAVDTFINTEATDFFNLMSEGCAPFNPFGSGAIPDDVLAFAFPTMSEASEIEQNVISVNFSGEMFDGIGAGSWQAAAGLDWREEETINRNGDGSVVARDFSSPYFVGGEFYSVFGDGWAGTSTNTEAFLEFDLPLLRDKMASDYLGLNIANRRTKNESSRITGSAITSSQSATRYNDSWKATLSWQPVDVMRMRVTRSTDTRAPSARELYQTNTAAQAAGGETEIANGFFGMDTFRFNDPDTDLNESAENAEVIQAGNAALESEVSITETFGLVFTPIRTVPGLSASLDYYETTVKGGIEPLGTSGVVSLCGDELFANVPEEDWNYCNQVQFGDPDPTQRWDPITGDQYFDNDPSDGYFSEDGDGNIVATEIFPYSNITSLTTTQENVSPYWSRGLDLSIQYDKQLAGGGSISGRVLATRFLEQTIDMGSYGVGFPATRYGYGYYDVAGQTGANGLQWTPSQRLTTNYSPTPRISGNMFMTYAKNAFSLTAQLRYIGSGRLFNQGQWIGPGERGYYYSSADQGGCVGTQGSDPRAPSDAQFLCTVFYDDTLAQTVQDADLPSWATLNVNFAYDFGLSRFSMDRFQSLQVYMNISNIGDRIPDFVSGLSAGGINATYFSGMGREYNMGVRMSF